MGWVHGALRFPQRTMCSRSTAEAIFPGGRKTGETGFGHSEGGGSEINGDRYGDRACNCSSGRDRNPCRRDRDKGAAGHELADRASRGLSNLMARVSRADLAPHATLHEIEFVVTSEV